MKDEKIILEIQKGNTALFNELVKRHYEKIYQYCYYHVNHKETALDITQEVFIKVYENINRYTNRGKFKNYLYVIAGNLCKDFYKKRKSCSFESVSEIGDCEDIYQSENKIMVRQALSTLSEREYEIVILRFYQDLKYKDIAKITGVSISHVEYYLRTAIKKLKKYMEGDTECEGKEK